MQLQAADGVRNDCIDSSACVTGVATMDEGHSCKSVAVRA